MGTSCDQPELNDSKDARLAVRFTQPPFHLSPGRLSAYDWTMNSGSRIPDASDRRLPLRGLRVDGTRFWVIHRRREFGPFDYEWSHDLEGLCLLYRGHKFGEICGNEELFADLSEFDLPLRVAEVATLTLGCLLYGIVSGLNAAQRRDLLAARLSEHGYADFLPPFQS